MKKQIFSLVLVGSILTSMMVYAKEQIGIHINDDVLECDVAPIMENDRVLVPMRAIFEALGATIEWDDATQTVTATKDKKVISLAIDDTALHINEDTTTLDVPARLVNDRTLVPIRAVSESLGAKVGWDDEAQVVSIITGNESPNAMPAPGPEVIEEANNDDESLVENTTSDGEVDEGSITISDDTQDSDKVYENRAMLIAQKVNIVADKAVNKPLFAASGNYVYYVSADGKAIYRTGLYEKNEELFIDMSQEKADVYSDFTITGMCSSLDGRIYVCGVFNKQNKSDTECFAFAKITSENREYKFAKLKEHNGAQIAYVKDDTIHIKDKIFNTDTAETIKDNAPVLTGKNCVLSFEKDGVYYRYEDDCFEYNTGMGKLGDEVIHVNASKYHTRLYQGKLYSKDLMFSETMSFAGAFDGEKIVGLSLKRYSMADYVTFDLSQLKKGYRVIKSVSNDNTKIDIPFEYCNIYHRLEYVSEGVFVAFDELNKCLFTLTIAQ